MKKFINGILFLAFVGVVLTCCEKETLPEQIESSFALRNEIQIPPFDYTLIDGIQSNSEKSKFILEYYLNTFEVSELVIDPKIHNLLDMSVEKRFSVATSTNFITETDIVELKKLCSEIELKGSLAIVNFKDEYYFNSLDKDNQENLESILDVFEDDILPSEISAECAWAIAAFTAASVGLASITAATGGLAVVAAVAGYNIACVQLVQACKK